MEATALYEQFAYHLRIKRRSKNTLNFYDVSRRTLHRFLEQEGITPDTDELTVTHLRAFLVWLGDQGLGPGGIHAQARALKAVFNWGFREELLTRNPAVRLELPSLPKERQPTVTVEVMRSLLKACKGTERPLRDSAIVLMLLDTGLRVHELIGLKLEDLQFERGLIRVVGKGNKERFVPVGSKAMSATSAYLRRERKQRHPGVPHVFLSRSGEVMTRSGISIRLAKLARSTGIEREACAPHAFRRGFAVEFLRNGGDVFTLQQIMGHSSLDMTRRYVTFLDDDLKAAHLRFSPVDNL
ncbi:tyrosine-type recombinase/integrase [Deinococcus maricopensis]|uniref:Integrase family protein n=1 Tax=Deinococcus maricopensis (strain DSM 21211 / LMG 22137 / NRRL B-23946 / LB-34) TaxID=709986 RepID=E8U505_DEIML|nr:tyrosine-type recombinase/integrase [Deinococcus maricopensis]ADV66144.1 integrase family protein [Deinococcus maricopensis DSM 21211]